MCQACRRLSLCSLSLALWASQEAFTDDLTVTGVCFPAEGQGDGFQLCRVTAADALEWACFANSWEVSGWGQVTGDLQVSGNISQHPTPPPAPEASLHGCSALWVGEIWRRQATWQALSGHSHVGPGRRSKCKFSGSPQCKISSAFPP